MGEFKTMAEEMDELREALEVAQTQNAELLLEQERSDKEREMLWKKVEELERNLHLVSEAKEALSVENGNLWHDIKALGKERDALHKRAQQMNQEMEEMLGEIDARRKECEILRDALVKAEIQRREARIVPSAPNETPYPVVVMEINLLRAENTRCWNLLQSIFGGCYEDP